MAHKIWSDDEDKWVEASDERVSELQTNMVKPGSAVPIPPVKPMQTETESWPLPDGIEEGDTIWMVFNEQLNLDRAR